MTALAIVICTFHREKLLGEALDSIAAQSCPPGLRPEVIVVDNSDDGSARAVVAARIARFPFALSYITAHPANISVARNAGTRAAQTEYVAFLDDDQRLAPGWLDAVHQAVTTLPHDAFFGGIDPDFEAPERVTPAIRQLFSRHLQMPAGTELVAMGPLKTRGIALATNNSVFRRAAMLIDSGPFDPAFGAAGGEDYDLLCRMQRRGSRFGWMPAARAHEVVPAGRCDARYLRRRFFAGGQAFAAAVANSSANPVPARWWLRIRAAVQLVVMLPRLILRRIEGGGRWIDASFALAGILGKLSLGGLHPIYGDAAKIAHRAQVKQV